MPSRLLVRVGPDTLRGSEVQCGDRDSPPSKAVAHLQAWGMGRVYSEEAGTRSGQIKLIRSEESLSWLRYGFLERRAALLVTDDFPHWLLSSWRELSILVNPRNGNLPPLPTTYRGICTVLTQHGNYNSKNPKMSIKYTPYSVGLLPVAETCTPEVTMSPLPTEKCNCLENHDKRRLDEIGTEERLPLPEYEWDIMGNGMNGSVRQISYSESGGNGEGDCRRSSMAEMTGDLPSARHVYARVSAEGRTRVLLISSHKDIRRTISTFGAREAALVRLEEQARLVLERYRRWDGSVCDLAVFLRVAWCEHVKREAFGCRPCC